MTDRIDFGDRPWHAIPRELLRDPRMSPRARGGLVTLLSHEEGWVRSAIGTLMREADCGRQQAQAILRQLRELGYADLVTERTEDGRVSRHYVLRAVASEAQSSGSPVDGFPAGREGRRSGMPSIEVEALTDEASEEETPQELEPQSSVTPVVVDAMFETLFETFPSARKGSRREVRRAWDKAIRRADPETILAGAIRYRDDPNRDDEFTAGAARWLNRDGWEEGPLPPRHRRGEGVLEKHLRIAVEEASNDGGISRGSRVRGPAPGELPGVADH